MRRSLLGVFTIASALIALSLIAVACSETPRREGAVATRGVVSFKQSLRASADGTSRIITPLRTILEDSRFDDVSVLEGTFTDVHPDRAWVNLPEERIERDIDIKEVPWLDDSAQFRTIVASFEVSNVVKSGLRRTLCGRSCVVDVTFALYDLAAMGSARSTLTDLGRSVIVVTEGERGAFGVVTRLPGDDLVIAIDRDGSLRLPLSDDGTTSRFLGDMGTAADLRSAAVAR